MQERARRSQAACHWRLMERRVARVGGALLGGGAVDAGLAEPGEIEGDGGGAGVGIGGGGHGLIIARGHEDGPMK